MTVTAVVVYPQNIKFDMDYYLKTHMPLVQSKWGQYGLKSWEVYKYPSDAPHSVAAHLIFEDSDGFKKAAGGPEAAEVFGDVKNFTDGQAVPLVGEQVGKA